MVIGTIPFPGLLGGTRYLARMGVTGWMVWDHEMREPTAMAGKQAIGLSEETAKRFANLFNEQPPQPD